MKEEPGYPDEIKNTLTREDRETHINWTSEDRGAKRATVYTDDPVEYAKLLKKGHEPYECNGESAFFEIEYRLVSVRRNMPKRKVTEAQRRAASEKMKKLNARARQD